MHKLLELKQKIDEDYRGLGRLVAAELLAVKARKCLLVIAPAGCGKSITSKYIGKVHPRGCIELPSLTLDGLRVERDRLTGFNGVVVVDDISGGTTAYNRISTVEVLSHLTHDHFIGKQTAKTRFTIVNFHGSCIINIQPHLMWEIYRSKNFDAGVRDKTLRYYHLIRPVKPRRNELHYKVDWGEKMKDVENSIISKSLKNMGIWLWSRSRVEDHLSDLLRAGAAFDGRRKVNDSDEELVKMALQPCMLESEIIVKDDFESKIDVNVNVVYVISHVLSYRRPLVRLLCEDYKIQPRTADRLLSYVREYVYKNYGILKPTDKLKELIRRWRLGI